MPSPPCIKNPPNMSSHLTPQPKVLFSVHNSAAQANTEAHCSNTHRSRWLHIAWYQFLKHISSHIQLLHETSFFEILKRLQDLRVEVTLY
ncbi:hypothetical protein E2C01_020191 [Portunus trituberculatus]|uniref:Uncharacterized protein n=1 Tax=Portunus trituberculatus TaxID=210409 RepID=A0A5B7E0V6_PORTR|nr:hypothetical protein [Portunus trituberculatus]